MKLSEYIKTTDFRSNQLKRGWDKRGRKGENKKC